MYKQGARFFYQSLICILIVGSKNFRNDRYMNKEMKKSPPPYSQGSIIVKLHTLIVASGFYFLTYIYIHCRYLIKSR